jgi:3-oxoacyl-[acyl-carrier-protein] synthase-3
MTSSAIRALSLAAPKTVRTNSELAESHPEAFRTMEERVVFRQTSSGQPTTGWDQEMAPYLHDPFRGAVERRVVSAEETPRDLQHRAVDSCLAAAGLDLDSVDLMIVSSVFPQQQGPGDAAYLAERLGSRSPAINVESTCSGVLISMQLADSLIRTHQYKRILVVGSCAYSTIADPSDPSAWWLGDAAGALLLEPGATEHEGVRSVAVVDTLATCNTFYCELETTDDGTPRVRMRAHRNTGIDLSSTNEHYLRNATAQALRRAGITINDVDFLVVNTPFAWYADYACRVLGLARSRTINVYPLYGNVGPVLPLAAAAHAAGAELISAGDTVLFFSVGSVSTAVAAVVDWGAVAVAPLPPHNMPDPVAAGAAPTA